MTPVTSVPSVAVVVWPARNPTVVQPSSISSQWRPAWGIWTKWSMIQTLVKPASSPARAAAASRRAISVEPPAPVKLAICRPKSRAMGASS